MSRKRHFANVCWISLVLMVGPFMRVSSAQDLPPEVLGYADTVFYNGQVLTMDRDQPPINVTQAIAVRDGRVLAVGDSDRILRMAGPDTIRVDLEGRAVIPGVIDTHSHPNRYALSHYRQEYNLALVQSLLEQNVRYVNVRWESKETALSDFKRVAENVSPDELIYTTFRGNETSLALNRYDLDEVAPDNLLYVMIGSATQGIANTRMLDKILAMYGDRIPGILKDENGVPNGQIFGAAGTVIDQEVVPRVTPEVLAPFLKRELEEWVAIGVTTLSTRLKGNELTAYGLLDRAGELPLRLGYSHEIGRSNPFLERALKRFGNLQGHGTEWLWMIGISIGKPDGDGPGSRGNVCATPPKKVMLPGDIYPEGLCEWDMPGEPGADAVLVTNRYGYRVSGVHTFGDKGYLMMLDAYDQANQENSILGRSFGLDHGMMISPEIVKQSAQLDVTWSLQPPMFYSTYAAGVSRVYGEEYAHRWMLPVKSLIDAGAKVSYGADTHDDPQRQPMFSLEVLVTRKVLDGRVFGPREALDRDSALLMLTRWGAGYVLRDQELGSLEPGKLADLVVLDGNPLDPGIADENLSEIKVVATIIGGEVAYDPDDLVQ